MRSQPPHEEPFGLGADVEALEREADRLREAWIHADEAEGRDTALHQTHRFLGFLTSSLPRPLQAESVLPQDLPRDLSLREELRILWAILLETSASLKRVDCERDFHAVRERALSLAQLVQEAIDRRGRTPRGEKAPPRLREHAPAP